MDVALQGSSGRMPDSIIKWEGGQWVAFCMSSLSKKLSANDLAAQRQCLYKGPLDILNGLDGFTATPTELVMCPDRARMESKRIDQGDQKNMGSTSSGH